MHQAWPVLRRYEGASLARIAMPVGGIGTGCVTLGGRGDLRDWEIVNRPAKGFGPGRAMLTLFAAQQDGTKTARVLEGPIDDSRFEGPDGATTANHGLPRFRACAFEATYPFGRVVLRDEAVPVEAAVEAFNPLVPGDVDASGFPAAVLRVRLVNRTDGPVDASVAFTLKNFIGTDGTDGRADANVNEFRRAGDVAGLFMHSQGVDRTAPGWGTLAVTTPADAGAVTHRTEWPDAGWGSDLIAFWDDFATDGRLEEPAAPPARSRANDSPVGSLAVSVALDPGATREVTFVLTWHFPNRLSWTPGGRGKWAGGGRCDMGEPVIGNHYTTRFADAWDAAVRFHRALPDLERRTRAFVDAVCGSDLPDVVKEAALFNLSTLKTQTVFRTPDGHFFGWEGVFERQGSCLGSCTHVWNYEQATTFLFADMARSMREIEFGHATGDDGHMCFRVHLPLEHARAFALAAADGQMGCLMRLYAAWKLNGDDAWLRSIWPRARKALEFCWIPGGWDADRDGVMEGCQHNTMDVEYYGPNPQMGTWYLGALRAGEEMARHMGEDEFADRCRELFERGRAWIEANLFNGEYYEHQVRPPAGADAVAPGLRHPHMGARDLSDPDFQLGAGCLIDQLVGQYMAHVCGLGYVLDEQRAKTVLASLMRYNFRETLWGHFNPMRSYALADESAMLMASYPRGRRPKRPFPYWGEAMTGFEYTAAVGMLQEGMIDEGLRVITAIRARYDGRRRNPFDEAECGRHYARAMASWGAVLAWSGFDYDARTATLTLASGAGERRHFWSTGTAWGTCMVDAGGSHAEIRVEEGTLRLKRLLLRRPSDTPITLSNDGASSIVAGATVLL